MKSRPYKDDYKKIMDFLREMYLETGRQRCWLPQRWEYAEHFVNHLMIERGGDDWHKYIRIWEEDDRIVAVCNKEEANDAYLQIRPGYDYLCDEMLEYAEEKISSMNIDGKRSLVVPSPESYPSLNEQLVVRGYTRGEDVSYFNRQNLDKVFIPVLPEGYSFADAMEEKDALRRYRVVNRAFNPDAEIPQILPESFIKMEQAPMFRPDLEILTKHPDGTLTSFCVVWYDEETGIGMFEPVGTHPDYQRFGLGREMLIEGLRRLKTIGARHAYVDSAGDDRKSFYNSAGFITYDRERIWKKEF